jgi:hypothetical protein
MNKKEIIKSAEQYCIQRGIAKGAFIEGALWALKQARTMMIEFTLELEEYEKEK